MYYNNDMFKDKAEKYQKLLTSWFSDVYIDKNEEYFKIDDTYGLIKK